MAQQITPAGGEYRPPRPVSPTPVQRGAQRPARRSRPPQARTAPRQGAPGRRKQKKPSLIRRFFAGLARRLFFGSKTIVKFALLTPILAFMVVFSYTVDMIMAGNQQSSQIFIVTHDYKAMADAMLYQANRGATVIDAQGWYSKEPSKIVMVVCRKRDTSMILKIVKTVDPHAFISVGSVMGVYGKGFDALNKV